MLFQELQRELTLKELSLGPYFVEQQHLINIGVGGGGGVGVGWCKCRVSRHWGV